MQHSFNLNRIAAQVKPDKVTRQTFYLTLINAFKGADVLTLPEIDKVEAVIREESREAISHLEKLRKIRVKKQADQKLEKTDA